MLDRAETRSPIFYGWDGHAQWRVDRVKRSLMNHHVSLCFVQ